MFLRRKKEPNALHVPKKLYLCSVKQKTTIVLSILGYGVMVTQQILVLFFLVRIRVAQQKGVLSYQDTFFVSFLFFLYLMNFYLQLFYNQIVVVSFLL